MRVFFPRFLSTYVIVAKCGSTAFLKRINVSLGSQVLANGSPAASTQNVPRATLRVVYVKPDTKATRCTAALMSTSALKTLAQMAPTASTRKGASNVFALTELRVILTEQDVSIQAITHNSSRQ